MALWTSAKHTIKTLTVPLWQNFGGIFFVEFLHDEDMTFATLYRSVLHQVDDEDVWCKGPQDVHKLVVGTEVRNKKRQDAFFQFLFFSICFISPALDAAQSPVLSC